MKVGSLLIDMAADVARLRADMNTAQGVVSSAVNKMQSAVDGLKKGIAGLAAGLTVGAFSAAIKNQLDIADAMGKTAERTGLAVKDVAGLKLAFDMSGVSSDKLETSLGKMAKNMAEGSKAFGAMGVQIKNADGTLRSTRDVLGDVADKFAGYRDGAEKTALAQELFGKSGTEMISVLNAGRAGLDEMDAQAKRLGLTLDEEATAKATQFNDTLTLLQAGGEGFTRQIAGRLAPTLASLAGELLGNVNQSESLNTISNVLSATLKGLYSAGAIGAQIFANLGRAVGAGAAAIMAVLRGDFAGAKDIMNDVASVNAANWKSQLESLGRLWDDTGAKGVQAMAGVSAASRSAAPTVASVGAAAKQAKDEFADLLNKLNAKDSGVDADYFKNLNILFAGFQKGRIGLGEYRAAVEQLTQSQQFAKDIQKQLIEVAKEHTAGVDAAIKADEDALLKNEASIKTAREMLEQIQFETRALKMTNVERAKAMALRDLERQGIEAGTQAYEAYAEAILKALDEKAVTEASIEAQNQIREEWQKTTDQMGQSLADALMNGGKSVAEYLKGLFRNLVLRPIIQPVATAMAGGFMGLFGGPAAAAGQGGGGGGGSLLNIGSSLFGAGGMAGSLMAGAGWLTGAASFGGIMGAAGSLIGTGTIAGIGSGLAMGLGAVAPVLLPLLALVGSGAFSRKHEQHNLQGTFGGASGFEGTWHDYYRGGLFRSSKTEDTPLDSATLNALRGAWKAQEAMVIDYAETLGLATDKIEGFTFKINLKLKDLGDPEAAGYMDKVWQMVNEAIATGSNEMAERILGTWTTTTREVEETIKTGFWDDETFTTVKKTVEETTYAASEYAREGENALATLTRLATSLKTVNGVFDTLGLTLIDASLAGGDLASKLVDAFGGLDKMQAAAASYFQNFYSEEERAATLKRQLTTQLGTLGFDLPGTREAYRQLVDAQDITTEAGRKNYAALMQLSEAFAQVTPAAGEAAAVVLDLTAQLQRAIDTLPDFADISAGALQELSKLFGGLDELTGAYGRYMDNFFTQQERQTVMFAQLGHDLRGLGIDTVPRTREEFRALVESLDLSTDSGRAAFAALIKLSPAFAQLVPAIDAVASAAATSAAAMIASANAAAQALVEVERDRLQALAAVARESANAAGEAARVAQEAAQEAAKAHSEASAATDRIFGQLSQKLSQAMGEVQKLVSDATSIRDNAAARRRQLLGEMADTRKMGAEAANAFLNEALRAALGGGRLPKPQDMANAIDDAIAGLDVNTYKSVAQYEADKAILAAKLGALAEVSDQQVSEGERQIELLQKQMDYWRQQIDILRGTQGSITSIDDGIAQLGQLIAAESAAAAANTTAQSTAAAAQSAATAAQAAAQAAATVAGQYNTKPAGAAASEFDRQVAAVRNASWYGNGDWQQARGLKLSVLSAAMGVDPADLAKMLIDQGLSLKGDLITTRQALGDVGLEADAIRRAAWYGSGNWDDARGSTLSGLAASMGVDPRDLERRLAQEGLYVNGDGIILSRRYAQGGQHAGGWRLVGEQGPEVEFTGPARYWSFDQSKAMLSGGGDNAELVAENRALRQKVDELIARVERVASATEMSARLMDRVTANGNAMRTETA